MPWSGIVRILAENPDIQLENDVHAKEFKVIIPRTTQKDKVTTQKSETTIQKEALKDSNTIQKSDSTTQKNVLKDSSTIQKNLDPSQKKVLDFFRKHPKATIDETVAELKDLSLGGVKFIIGKLQQKGLLKRVGGRKHGVWQVLIDE